MSRLFPSLCNRRAAFLLTSALAFTAALTGCGGGGGSTKQATLRLVNASTDVASLNLSLNSTVRLSGVPVNGQSEAITLDAGTYTVDLTNGSDTTALLSGSRSLSESSDDTAIAWGASGALRMTTLSDTATSTDAPATGYAAIRAFDAAPDAGALDIYLTAAGTDLDSVTPTFSAIPSGGLQSYVKLTSGSYRLRVTGAGDKTDLRLDLPTLTLANQARSTLLIQPGSGGMLVNALQLVYQTASTTPLKNTQARARLVAGVNTNGAVTASIGGVSLNVGLRSPSVGSYVLVPASDTQSVVVTVNSALSLGGSQKIAAGADYSLLVSGDAASPSLVTLTDDNRLPTSSTRAKLRLVHGAYGQDALTLAVDFNAVANNITYGSSSAFGTAAANASAVVEVSSPLIALPLYTTAAAPINLQAQGVYTVFMLGGGTAPTGVLRKDR